MNRVSPRRFWRERSLIRQLARREIEARYRGSVLGVLWSLVTPLLMLAVFTYVFSVVFQARWGTTGDDKATFALILFPGMIVNALFAECINRAPGLVLQNPNYVKKVVFPLEVLPVVSLLSSLFHFAASLAALLFFELFAVGRIPVTAFWAPIVLTPLLLIIVGVSWFLASLGVYLRDLAQLTGVATTVLMFMSPVFYPASALPDAYRGWLHASPLTYPIEALRETVIYGRSPDFEAFALYAAIAVMTYAAGLYWFQRTRRGFADVI